MVLHSVTNLIFYPFSKKKTSNWLIRNKKTITIVSRQKSMTNSINFPQLKINQIKNAISDIKSCIAFIDEQLQTKLELCEIVSGKGPDIEKLANSSAEKDIDKIENSFGFIIFKKLINNNYPNEDYEVKELSLLDIISAINPQTELKLPWSVDNYLYLFDEVSEEYLLSRYLSGDGSTTTISKDKISKKVFGLSAQNEMVLATMLNEKTRGRDLFITLMRLIIAKELKSKISIENLNLSGRDQLKLSKNRAIDIDPSSKEFDEVFATIKDNFFKYFSKLEKNIIAQNILPKDPLPNDEVWNELLNSAQELKNTMIFFQKVENNMALIMNYQLKGKLSLFKEINEFLIKNDLDEMTIPTISKLGKDYSGGYALVKKIAFKGGLKIVRSEYAQWLINKKSPGNSSPLNSPKEEKSEKINYV